MSAPVTSVELLKALRGRERSRYDLQDELGLPRSAIDRWLKEWFAQGLVTCRLVKSHGCGTKMYTLAPMWIGRTESA